MAQHDENQILSLKRACREFLEDDDNLFDIDDIKRIIEAGKYQLPKNYAIIKDKFDNVNDFFKIHTIKSWCKKYLLKFETKTPNKKLTQHFPPHFDPQEAGKYLEDVQKYVD